MNYVFWHSFLRYLQMLNNSLALKINNPYEDH